MVKLKEKNLACILRKSGKSLGEISKKLNISKSTVSLWCSNISLNKKQKKKLELRRMSAIYKNIKKYSLIKKQETKNKIKKLKDKGIKEVGKLNKREFFIAGIALYWGEGFKKDHQVGLATLDKNIAGFYISWLKQCFSIKKADLIVRVTANIYYKNKIKSLEKFWSNELDIPLDQFSKPFFQNTKWKKNYDNINNYHGVIRIKVRRSVNFLRKIYGFIEGLSLNIN